MVNTPRIGLNKLASDGSDTVDLAGQINSNWDICDGTFIPLDNDSTSRPNSPVGIGLYEGNTVSHLKSVAANEWNVVGSHSPLYSYPIPGQTIPNGNVEFKVPIQLTSEDNRVIRSIAADTVRLMYPGFYYFNIQNRWDTAGSNPSGTFHSILRFKDTSGVTLQDIVKSRIRNASTRPTSVTIQTLYRTSTPQTDVNFIIKHNSSSQRDLQSVVAGQGQYNWFQVVYLRPLVQGK